MVNHVLAERDALRFVAEQRLGVSVNRALLQTLEASDQWRYAARAGAYGDAGLDVASARKVFDQRLDQLQQAMGNRLDGLAGGAPVTVAQRLQGSGGSVAAAAAAGAAAVAAPAAAAEPTSRKRKKK